MATNTYVALDKKTVTSAVAYVEFTSVPQTYTDLIIVSADVTGSTYDQNLAIQVGNNSADTGNNYSQTGMYGNGSSTNTWRATNNNKVNITYATGLDTRAMGITHIMGYANTSTYKPILSRSGGVGGTYNCTDAIIGEWRSQSAINTIRILSTGVNLAVGCTFSLYGIRAEGISPAPKATGGAIYSDSTYYYHVFGSTGVFTPNQSISADVLVVAGGGGAGGTASGNNGGSGGGGAGGYRLLTSQSFSNATAYTCTIGAGGAGGPGGLTNNLGSAGGNSSIAGSGFTTITSSGGGAGSGQYTSSSNATTGGSGGGGAWTRNGASGNAGGYTPVEGYAGGIGGTGTAGSGNVGGGGGGGAGAAGGNTTATNISGAGGNGSSSASSWGQATGAGQNINGTYYFAGGGAGGAYSVSGVSGLAGYGGGALGVSSGNGLNGTANTGGGGGGTGANASNSGGAGGSGVIIVRYLKA